MDGKMIGIIGTALRSNLGSLSKPYKLNFSVTYSCQSRCLTCSIWQMHPKNELTIEEIREFAGKNTSFRWIELTGGEVFIRDDIDEITKAFKEHCKGLYILTMPTNSLCNQSLVRRKLELILGLGIPRLAVTVSLDGYRELHDKIRGVQGNYEKAIAMARMLREMQEEHRSLSFVFGYTMSKLNHGALARTIEEVAKEVPGTTYNDFHVNLSQLSSNYYNNTGLDIKADGKEAAREIRLLLGKRHFSSDPVQIIEAAFLRNLARYAETGKQPMSSRSGEASVFLDSFGNVYPSIMWDKKLGNIRETGYYMQSILGSDAAKGVRALIKEGREPLQWTSCEAYQALLGNLASVLV